MSQATYAGFKVFPSENEVNNEVKPEDEVKPETVVTKNTWPPSEEEIKTIASSALNQSDKKDFKVLVYWDNPNLMIYDPIYLGSTDYVKKVYTYQDRKVEVIIGKED